MRTHRLDARRFRIHAAALLPAAAALLLVLGLVAPAEPQDFGLAGTQPIDPLPGHDPPLEIEHLFIPPQGAVPFGKACIQCHDVGNGEPYLPWQGSMMAQAARDPLFYAQLDLAAADGAARPAVDGMADMCLRCHSPVGWLEGRSSDHSGMSLIEKDLFGVQCHFCHRLVDPLNLAADPADIETDLDAEGLVPPTFGNGMYVVDPKQTRRGPFGATELTAADHLAQLVETPADWNAVGTGLEDHPVFDSAFHRSGNLCGTCHDVSNPKDCPPGIEETDVQHCFPIERTWSEWTNSAFASRGEAGNCQSCHMSGPHNGVGFGAVCEGGSGDGHLNDVHFHDLTGGNAVVPLTILAMKERYDDCVALGVGCPAGEQDFVAAVDALYPPAGSSPFAGLDENALAEGAERAVRTLRRSATLEVESVSPDLTLKLTNLTGHKLPTGYPEGRRMWMNVRFVDAGGGLAAESGEYDAATGTLFHDQNVDGLAGGGVPYDVVDYTDGAGVTVAGPSRPTKVWEARSHWDGSDCVLADPADCPTEFHFVLGNQRVMDNRIPPEGWTPAAFTDVRAEPAIPAAYLSAGWQWDYVDAGTPVHYDRFAYPLPAGTDRVRLTLNYQTASREYIEALRDDNPSTLTAGGYNRGTLLHEMWEQTGRFAPVSLLSRVQAIVDADGDELADGWEAQHGLGEPGCAEEGYNDDPDGDGLSNWQEFQLDHHPTLVADPCDPALPSSDPPRTPVDVILVLDRSGSMDDPAPVTGTRKIEVLQEAVELFLETWRDHAIPADRIGLVWFGDQAEVFGGTLLHSFFDTWEDIRDEVLAKEPTGWTAMGAGLHLAMEPLKNPVTQELIHDPANPRNRHLILFSNGMQNRSPMVVPDVEFPEFLVVRDQTPAENPDVTGGSNVVIGADLFSAFPLAPHTLHVHTVGIGVVENSGGEGWHALLQDLAVQQHGKHNFITDARQLEGVFLEDLVASLKGETLEYLFEEEITLAGGEPEELKIPVNPTAKKLSVVVSWDDRRSPPPRMELLRPDGRAEDLRLIGRGGERYRIITRYFDRRTGDPAEAGVWTLRLAHPRKRGPNDGVAAATGAQGLPPLAVRVHAVLDDTALEYDFGVPRELRLGDPFKVTALAIEDDRPLRWMDEVTVTVRRPGASIGELLARSRHRLEDPSAVDPDAGSSPFQRKLLAAYADPDFVARLTPAVDEFDLLDDGTTGDSTARDGVFSRLLPAPAVPGHWRLHFRIVGHTSSGHPFEREETRSVVVRIGPISPEESGVERVRDAGTTWVRFTPRDAAGNLLGPGWTSHVLVLTADRRQLGVEDLLDGSYRAPLPADLGEDAPVTVSLGDETFHDGPVPAGGPGCGCIAAVVLIVLLSVVVAVVLIRRRSGP